ncbi:hypothetical protein DPMN_128185 [Dreissena polymorpha]|uniref:Uncharacterized protein n=1 Tax=Dreissena polymorpha TaxID=45954 RepID=A0A9D4H0N1_DREPO|nr:hypothetical protein DPMN_128185 [Dreissena polymorpha]
MDATTKFASNVTLINVTEQETFNTTSSNFSDWRSLLWRLISPILFPIGTIGNAVTIFVLLRQKMTSTVSLFALALSNTLISCSARLPYWVSFTWGVDI